MFAQDSAHPLPTAVNPGAFFHESENRLCLIVVLPAVRCSCFRASAGGACRRQTMDLSLGYSYVSQGQRLSSPVGLTGGDAGITVGYSRLGFKVDLGYVRAAALPGKGQHTDVLSYLAGPVFHPLIHRNFDTYIQVLAGAFREIGPVPLGGDPTFSGDGRPASLGPLAGESNIG